MPELQRLRSDHADAVLAFERCNRRWFAASVSDRGDDYFDRFAEHHALLLDEQEAGACIFHVLVDDDGAILGRFNLFDLSDGSADVGYRVAERVAGRGVATSTLLELCGIARERYGLRRLAAKTKNANVGSRRVLEKAGFVAIGATEVAGAPGTRYTRSL